MAIASINPATGETLTTFVELSAPELERAIALAASAFRQYGEVPMAERSRRMIRAAEILEEERSDFGRIMALEMGKPIGAARDEAIKCARACRYYAENAERMLAPEEVATDAKRSYVVYQPLGVVLAVMPWNFPFWQVFRFAAPALMAGNVALLKHASNVPQCALSIEEIFRRAGFEDGIFTSLLVGSEVVGRLLEDPRIVAATLTGSEDAGRSVASIAGKNLKKTVLELGGSDPYVLLNDADLDASIATCVYSRLINSGQSCVAAKRFICTEAIAPEVERLFVAHMSRKTMGDPLTNVDVGPQARIDLRDELHRQVRDSVGHGARVLMGGERPVGPGAFYPPTVLSDVRKGSPAYDEELFGPAAALIVVNTEDEALRVANDTPFGLGAAVFTRDIERGTRIAVEDLEAGNSFVNAFVRSDPRLPFGGIKQSGYGRELSSFGIREFVNIKTVWVA